MESIDFVAVSILLFYEIVWKLCQNDCPRLKFLKSIRKMRKWNDHLTLDIQLNAGALVQEGTPARTMLWLAFVILMNVMIEKIVLEMVIGALMDVIPFLIYKQIWLPMINNIYLLQRKLAASNHKIIVHFISVEQKFR